MHPSLSSRRGPVAIAVGVLAALLVLDLGATAVVHLRTTGGLPDMPTFYASSLEPGTADPYRPPLDRFGFVTRGRDVRTRPDGTVRRLVDGRAVFDPEASARFALGALAEYRVDRDPRQLNRAADTMAEVAQRAPTGLLRRPAATAPASVPDLPNRWVSAQTQGLALSAVARLYEVTRQKRWRSAANAIFDSLVRFRGYPGSRHEAPEPWFSAVDGPGYIWFETYPQSSSASNLMTGHLFALFGISDYARIAPAERQQLAATLFAGGARTVQEYIPIIRTPFVMVRASPQSYERSIGQHQLLVAQLGRLAELTGARIFAAYARDLIMDVQVPYFRVTGIRPRGDIDIYAETPLSSVMPPSSETRSDISGSERGQGAAGPDAVVERAIGDLEQYSRSRDNRLLRRARTTIAGIVGTWHEGLVPHDFFATNVYGEALDRPWYSAQTQGLLLSALVRLADMTGESRWRNAAKTVFGSLQQARDFPGPNAEPPKIWLLYVGDEQAHDNLWFEKYPLPQGDLGLQYGHPSFVVDAHLSAIIGIYDYWRLTRSRVAAHLIDGGLSTLLARASEIRVPGQVSRTDLQSANRSIEHHRVTTRQIDALAHMTGNKDLLEFARNLAEDAK
jgi:hypothetical protein